MNNALAHPRSKKCWIYSVCLGVIAVAVAGCGSGGGGGESSSGKSDTTPPTLDLTTIVVTGSTDTEADVTLAGIVDEDGLRDESWTITLNVDGVDLPQYTAGTDYDEVITLEVIDSENLTTLIDYEIALTIE